MTVKGIDHVNIRTMDIEASVKFYVETFGFEYRRGPLVMGHQGHWLCDDAGRAIIHFRKLEAGTQETGPLDHIALACQGREDILGRLTAQGIKYAVAENLIPGLTQVVLKDPHGVQLELQFAGE
jgi:catechol 2,3-dioxygenase-like lactoylglutathione lyase family enzyme